MQPLWDYVLLERDEDLMQKILRPDEAKGKIIGTLELIVIATGPDCTNIQIADHLVFNPAAAVTFAFEGKQCWLISERATGVVIAPQRKIKKKAGDLMPL